ncbi:hypothetical protein [Blastopirellula retiformator]|uniref:Uncharacterized protein n=1 Tax=Blastopirellula retiformator TaxID=2527970 RepID=A0A5C5V5M3_9BACT|nr:hypothetical protein [Blastopirellula retiformator]TWT33087.1 hypothetical protein Enr8_29070 [Blastopirellula retiformator]
MKTTWEADITLNNVLLWGVMATSGLAAVNLLLWVLMWTLLFLHSISY